MGRRPRCSGLEGGITRVRAGAESCAAAAIGAVVTIRQITAEGCSAAVFGKDVFGGRVPADNWWCDRGTNPLINIGVFVSDKERAASVEC